MQTDSPAKTGLRVVIVGGGTSGWMAAALLSRALPRAVAQLTVIEPPGPRGIGVGEASIPSLVNLLHTLGADEGDFLRKCEATWKLAIRFKDWNRIGGEYWHPFGVCGAKIDGRDVFPYWLAEHRRGTFRDRYHSLSLHHAACVAGKGPHSLTMASPISQTLSYAFHFNAEALASWLRERALLTGVSEQNGKVQCASLDGDGTVTAVHLDSGATVDGDFFIDCSGFQSVLMARSLRDPFLPWTSHLLCDRACAVKIETNGSVPPFTTSLALPAGWIWQIPLAGHLGLGYVFSSQFASDEDAWTQMQTALPELGLASRTPRFLPMRVGRQSSFWKNNVLALGLAAGFLEPLESTGIHLSQIGIEHFIRLFPRTVDVALQRDQYNTRMSRTYDEVRDFVQLHYRLSQRSDSEFWLAARQAPLSNELTAQLELYSDNGTLTPLMPQAFADTSYYHILTGNDVLPRRVAAPIAALDSTAVSRVLMAITQQNADVLRQLPAHEELLNRVLHPAQRAA